MLQRIQSIRDLYPDNIAYYVRNRRLTYAELWDQSDALASWLAEEYPGDRTPVAVFGHMQPEMLICFLACVKSGHAYVPIDESTPPDRIASIVRSSGTQLVLSPGFMSEEAAARKEAKANVIGLPELERLTETRNGQRPPSEAAVGPDDNFYIVYTSGSTGEPKGVQITLACLDSFVGWAEREFRLKPRQVYLNQAPYSFDLSVMDVYPALVTGGALCAVDKELIQKPKQLFEWLAGSGVNIWTSTPSFAEMCLMDSSFREQLMPELDTFLFCGEVLSNECARRLLERFPRAKVFNSYGPTEATVAVTSVEITGDIAEKLRPLPVGRCKPDCKLLILGDEGSYLPDGEKGEIVIAGPSVSPGYWRNPLQTAKAFTVIDGEKAYRTGDTGLIVDGMLYYGGRKDFQIKLHGYRIEIEDIENNLNAAPLVKAAIVLPVYKEGKCDCVAAVIVPEEHSFAEEYQLAAALRKQLAERVPAYMIPRKILFRQSLPMTPNGKADRKLLEREVNEGQ